VGETGLLRSFRPYGKFLNPRKYYKRARRIAYPLICYVRDKYGPETRKISYKGFKVYFSRGTSLIERIRQTGHYEPETVEAIVSALKTHKGALVDVGANIGLISLATLSEIPSLKVFAFEPGPHQRKYFALTIAKNNLGRYIKLSPLAMGDKRASATFYTHDPRHVSGDGLLDTGRAGTAQAIKVKVETLDHWWQEQGKPEVSVLKLDIEGAELLALRGAQKFLKVCRPTIFIEIHSLNLKNYPYGAEDVFDFLKKAGYQLYTYSSKEVRSYATLIKETDFIAKPARERA
jgi:FkbM family methyltransferase